MTINWDAYGTDAYGYSCDAYDGPGTIGVTVSTPSDESTANTPSSGSDGDPVNTFNGELYNHEGADINLGGPLPLVLKRYYASYLSRAYIRGELGDNWRHNYEWSIHWTGNNLVLIDSLGRSTRFTSDGAGTWTQQSNKEAPYQIVQTGNVIDILDPRSELVYHFSIDANVNAHRLTEIRDLKGNVLTLYYWGWENSNYVGKLGSVSDGLGRELEFGYFTYTGPKKKLWKVVELQGGVVGRNVLFSHTMNGDVEELTGARDMRGNTTNFTYAAPDGADRALMESKTRPAGNTPYSQTYYVVADGANSGRVKTQTDALTNLFTFDYLGSTTTMTDAQSFTKSHVHTATGELTSHQGEDAQSIAMTHDAEGRRTSVTDRLGETSAYAYHGPSGKLASITNADGTSINYSYTARVTGGFTFYDLTTITYPDASTEKFTYDANGNRLTHVDRGNNTWSYTYNTRGQTLTATNPKGGVTTYTYNADATLASVTSAAGNTTNYSYDTSRRLTTITFADTSTRSLGYDNNDNLLSVTDGNGNTTSYVYDTNNNLTTITDAAGNSVTMAYDAMDRVTSVTDRNGNAMSNSYDAMGRLSSFTDKAGNTSTIAYDARGRVSGITDAQNNTWSVGMDAESILASVTNPLGDGASFSSDTLGRITGATDALGGTTTLSLNSMGQATTVQDPLGRNTTLSYDAQGRVSGITLPGGLIGATYTRDSLGKLTTITDPAGNNWQRSYDNAGRQTAYSDPLGGTVSYTYDGLNRIANVTYAGGGTQARTYDGNGNLTRRLYSDGVDLNFTYDALNRLTAANGVTLTYDNSGNIVNSNGIAMTRDAAGRIATLTLAVGKAITYSYNNRDLLASVADWTGATTTFGYDNADRLTTIARPNGITTTYSYDANGQIVGISDGALATATLTRNAVGEITSATRTTPQTRAVSAGSTQTLAFDAAAQINANTYDADGRRTVDATRNYSWNLANRLTGYTEGPATVSFTYDAMGGRTSRTEGAATRNYVLNYALGLTSANIEKDGANDLYYYITTPGGALLYRMNAADNTRHDYHFDEMGNTLFMSDSLGAVVNSYAYSPYGSRLSATEAVENNLTWQGQFGIANDRTSGLYYVRDRYYDAATARFISRDRVRGSGPKSVNPYQYAFGNAMSYVDLNGTSPFTIEGVMEQMSAEEIQHVGMDKIRDIVEEANAGEFGEYVDVGDLAMGLLQEGFYNDTTHVTDRYNVPELVFLEVSIPSPEPPSGIYYMVGASHLEKPPTSVEEFERKRLEGEYESVMVELQIMRDKFDRAERNVRIAKYDQEDANNDFLQNLWSPIEPDFRERIMVRIAESELKKVKNAMDELNSRRRYLMGQINYFDSVARNLQTIVVLN
ncbi:MAG: DUF6531 domain-containing protein [Chromatiales bacterium]|nr:DUF6531 domain-containing protein [Chromatiales bacterium]